MVINLCLPGRYLVDKLKGIMLRGTGQIKLEWLIKDVRQLQPMAQLKWKKVRCSQIIEINQITPYKKYCIPVYRRFNFPDFESFPASSSVSPIPTSNRKMSNYFILEYSFRPNRINRCYCWGPSTSLDTKITQNYKHHTFDIKWHQMTVIPAIDLLFVI